MTLITFYKHTPPEMSEQLRKRSGRSAPKPIRFRDSDGDDEPVTTKNSGSTQNVREKGAAGRVSSVSALQCNASDPSHGADVGTITIGSRVVNTTIIRTPPEMNMHLQCAAQHLCGMSTTQIVTPNHHCMNCCLPMHGSLCGQLWSDRGPDVVITIGE